MKNNFKVGDTVRFLSFDEIQNLPLTYEEAREFDLRPSGILGIGRSYFNDHYNQEAVITEIEEDGCVLIDDRFTGFSYPFIVFKPHGKYSVELL